MDFDQLYKEQFPVVYRYLAGLCGNQALAEELTQETFCRAIEHSASFQGKCRLSVWLCQIGKNCWLSYLRKAKRQAGDEALEQMTSPQNPCSARAIPGGVYPAGLCGTTLYTDRRIVRQI